MKKTPICKTICIILSCITLSIALSGCLPDKYKNVEQKPYFCYHPLDWGMTYDEVQKALNFNPEAFRSAVGKTSSGLPSTAYIGIADIFDFSSDVTFWFTAYNEGEPEGLSAITIASSSVPGKKAKAALGQLITAYQVEIDTQHATKKFDGSEETLITESFFATPLDTLENDFASSWNSLLTKRSEYAVKDEPEYLSTATLKYMENGKKHRLDINGEPAAYYNYLSKTQT